MGVDNYLVIIIMIRTATRTLSLIQGPVSIHSRVKFCYSQKDERFVLACFTIAQVHWLWCQVLVWNPLVLPASETLHSPGQGSNFHPQPSSWFALVGYHHDHIVCCKSHYFSPHFCADEENFQNWPCLAHICTYKGRMERLQSASWRKNKDQLAALPKIS